MCNAKFQFQYGAIKRAWDDIAGKPETLFQFQYGAIKSKIF